MRTFSAVLILLLVQTFSFAQFSDNFSDGDFTNNPAWTGDVSEFTVNASNQLQSQGPIATAVLHLSTPNSLAVNCQWEFWVWLDFNPSSSNYARVYLVSDMEDTEGNLNGYFIQLGKSGSGDAVELWRQDGASTTQILNGIPGRVDYATNVLKIKVARDASGNWDVYSDTTGTGTVYVLEGSVNDNTYTTTSYFGVRCNHTSTRWDKFYFDDFSVIDAGPPAVSSAVPISQNQLDVFFSENVEQTTAETESNYSVDNGIGNPSSALRDAVNFSLVHLTFTTNFTDGLTNTLTVTNVQDLSGNPIGSSNTATFTYFTAPQKYDIVINEIMADPSPPVNLPDAEYIELFNRSGRNIQLNNWTFSDGTTTGTLGSYVLKADSFLILTSTTNASLFASYGAVMALSSFPSLNNTGDNLTLKDNSGNLIHYVNYTDSWYQDAGKSDGGYSLEMIDSSTACAGMSNWRASNDANGGTPGKQNSVFGNNPDNIAPVPLRASVIDSVTVKIVFDESLDSAASAVATNYSIDNAIGNPTSVTITAPDFTEVILKLSSEIISNTIYTLTINNTADCIGNADMNAKVQFAVPLPAEPGDIVINEILFNTYTGGTDFVEIYNNSNKVIDLKNLKIGELDMTKDSTFNMYALSSASYLLYPKKYLCLSYDISLVKKFYNTPDLTALYEMSGFPSYDDDEGGVILTDSAGTWIDRVRYYDDWHLPTLISQDGVSLERLDFNGDSNSPDNWHSASSTAGYATPGYKNSQAIDNNSVSEGISIAEPKTFSPDNDGYHDVLVINYKFSQPGQVIKILIFDQMGRQVRTLKQNTLLGTEAGTFTWDGMNDKDEKCRMGIYVLYAEVTDVNGGKVKKYKEVCVLASKLN